MIRTFELTLLDDELTLATDLHCFLTHYRMRYEEPLYVSIKETTAHPVNQQLRKLQLQAGKLPFARYPDDFTYTRGIGGAYADGFEAGYRGWHRQTVYTSSRHREAWFQAYDHGQQELEKALQQ